jgi:hypothetical protein
MKDQILDNLLKKSVKLGCGLGRVLKDMGSIPSMVGKEKKRKQIHHIIG